MLLGIHLPFVLPSIAFSGPVNALQLLAAVATPNSGAMLWKAVEPDPTLKRREVERASSSSIIERMGVENERDRNINLS